MDFTAVLADLIAESYKKKPGLTVFGIFFGITMVAIAVFAAAYLEKRDFQKIAPKEISEQLIELEKFDDGLKKLSAFIAIQKQQLAEKQKLISDLESKRTELEPIVNSQSEVVEAIFKAQEQRAQKSKWFDLSLGFVLGIFGSLIASVIFKLMDRRTKNA